MFSAAPTALSVAASSAAADYGQDVTLTATVSSTSTVSEGSVTFWDDAATLGTQPVSAGTAILTVALPSGSNNVTATYTDSLSNFANSSTTVGASSVIQTIGGNGVAGYFGDNGQATGAEFNSPAGIAIDSAGDLFIADFNSDRIREINAVNHVITTVAGNGFGGYSGDGGQATAAELYHPWTVAVDSAGDLFIADYGNDVIREVNATTHVITTVAGNGIATFAGDGGQATAASLDEPSGLAVDSAGDIYISDYLGSRVREVNAVTGVITTVAGNGNYGFAGDGGLATAATLYSPQNIAVDSSGNLYIDDYGNSRIREVNLSTGVITTIAGDGGETYSGDGGPATAASLQYAYGLTVDAAGDVFIADTYNDAIREVSPATHIIITVAGTGIAAFSGDGGPATAARLSGPYDVAVDASGNLFLTDTFNNRVREVTSGVEVSVSYPTTTVLSAQPSAGYGQYVALTATVTSTTTVNEGSVTFYDGATDLGTQTVSSGNATLYTNSLPFGVDSITASYSDPSGQFSPSSTGAAAGIINTIAGSNYGDGGPATAANFNRNNDVAVDSAGNVYVLDSNHFLVREINAVTGVITTVVGTGDGGNSGDGGPATAASLDYQPEAIALDSAGDLFVAGSHLLREVNHATGIINTIAGGGQNTPADGVAATSAGFGDLSPNSVTVDSSGDVFLANGNQVFEIKHGTTTLTLVAGNGTNGYSGDGSQGTAAELNGPAGMAVDSSGNLFIYDYNNNRIREVNLSTGIITTAVGNGNGNSSGNGGPATAASFSGLGGLALDSAGDIFLTDGNTIREVVRSTGIIQAVAGNGYYGHTDGPGTAAEFYQPSGLAIDSSGNIYVADMGSGYVRKINTSDVVSTIAGDGASYNSAYTADGALATVAMINDPTGVVVDSAGDVFYSDYYNAIVREVNHLTGVITTVAGDRNGGLSGDGGPATAAQLNGPMGLALDSQGDLFIADSGNNRIREVNLTTGVITTYAGITNNYYGSYFGDGGLATAAGLNSPRSVAFDSAGNLYIADEGNDRIREVVYSTGNIITYAGNGSGGYSGDGQQATAANISEPNGVAVDSSGNVYIADSSNNVVREVNHLTGIIATVAGNGYGPYGGDGGPATAAELDYPTGIAVDAAGDIFISNPNWEVRVREVLASGIIITAAGVGTTGGYGVTGFSGDGGPATNAELNGPAALAVDSSGDLYIADSGNNRIREVGAGGTTIDITQGTPYLYASDSGGQYDGSPFPATAYVNGQPSLEGVTPTLVYYSGSTTTGTPLNAVPSNAGTYTVVASFAGSTDYTSASSPSTFFIGQAAVTITLTATPSSVTTGAPVTLTATLSGTTVPNEGSVTFTYGSTTLGTVPVSAGVATLAGIASLPTGLDTITAVYTDPLGNFGEVASGLISTVAGVGTAGGNGGPATQAELDYPNAVAFDSAGNAYIVDNGNNQIREVNHATGVITLVAGNGTAGYSGDGGQATAAELAYLTGVAVDSAGDLFIADSGNSRIREVNHATGIITTIAGNGTFGYGGDGGPATAASLWDPNGVAVDSAGNVFIADRNNNVIREVVNATGNIMTFAGDGLAGFVGDGGQATLAELNGPNGVAVDSAGNVYVTDFYNQRVREINRASGVITTVAGDGNYGYYGDGGQATAAELSDPSTVAVDSAGDIFIADQFNLAIREVKPGGLISTIAGIGTAGFSGDGGQATAAELNYPAGVAVDSAGDVLIADSGNNRVREINTQGVISTFAGIGSFYSGDGGPATAAAVYNPLAVAIDSSGDIFIADFENNRIREINHATGNITTIAGNGVAAQAGDGGPATAAELLGPTGVAVDSAGDVFIIDESTAAVREVNHTTGIITTAVGNGSYGDSGDGGQATAAEIGDIQGITISAAGILYLADEGYSVVRDVNLATGVIGTYAGNGTYNYAGDGGQATAAAIGGPGALAVDSAGDLFIIEESFGVVREVTPNGMISTIAGSYGNQIQTTDGMGQGMNQFYNGDGGPATAAFLQDPNGLAVDTTGNVYIAEGSDVRVVNRAGIIFTYAGTGNLGYNGDGIPATAAELNGATGLAVDSAGDLLLADEDNSRVREVMPGGTTVVNVGMSQSTPTVTVSDGGGTYSGSAYPATATVNGSASLESVTPTLSYYSGTTASGTALGNAPSNAGTYAVVASFAGSTDYTSAQSGPLVFVITPVSLTLALTSTPSSAVQGQPVTLKGTLSGSVIPNEGSVTFSFGGTNLGTAPVNAGMSSLTTSALPVGVDTISASLSDPTGNFVLTSAISGYIINAFAGSNAPGAFAGDGGLATAASINGPDGIAVDSAGDVYFADYYNCRVREVKPDGTITTVAGNGAIGESTGDGGLATAAALDYPIGVAIDAAGDLFISEYESDVVREVNTATGIISTVVGGGWGSGGDGGPATAANLKIPQGLAVNSAGTLLFIADTGNDRIREVNLQTGIITTYAGNGTQSYGGDGGPATAAGLALPTDVALDSAGDLFIADFGNSRVREVAPNGTIITYAGTGTFGTSGDGGQATAAELGYPLAVAVDSSGNLFVSDRNTDTVRLVTSSGIITTVAGTGTAGFSGDGGSATAAAMDEPVGLAVNGAGDVYISDSPYNNEVRELTTSGSTTQVTITAALPTLSVTDTGGTYNGSAYAATATVNGGSSLEDVGLSLTYYFGTVASGTALSGAPSAAGTYTVLASFAGSTDYTSAEASTGFTISKASPTVTVNDLGGPYTGSPYPATDSVNGNASLESVSPTLSYYSGTAATGTALGGAPSIAGTYTVLASFAGSTDYASGAASLTFTITVASTIVSVMDGGGSYTGSAYPATATVNGGASLEGITPSLTYYAGTAATGTALSGAPSITGTYTVLASFAGSMDYAAGSATKTFSITKASSFVSVLDASGPYTGSPYAATEMVDGGASLEGITPTITYYSGTAASGTALSGAPSIVGTYSALASFAGSTDYLSSSGSRTFSITQATVFVSVLDGGGPYIGSPYGATVMIDGGASLEGVTPTLTYYSGTAATGTTLTGGPSNAGTYTVLASFAGSTDYATGVASTSFSITKASATVTVLDGGGPYNGSPYPATDTVDGGASLEGVVPTLTYYSGTAATGTTLTGAPSTAGTYTVLASFAGSTDYSPVSATTTFSITQATVSVSVLDSGGGYNGSSYPASATVNGSASLEGVTPMLAYYSGTSATGTAMGGVPSLAGTYTVVGSFAGSTDYASGEGSTTYSIAKAAPTVSVLDPGGTYTGSPIPATTSSIESVLPTLTYYCGTAASGTALTGAPSNAGTYTVLASFAGSTDYATGAASASYSITKAASTVTVTDLGGPYTGSSYSATARVNGGSSLEGVAPMLTYYSGTAASGIPLSGAPAAAGTYAALASFPGSTDYTSAAASTTFTISETATTVVVTDGGGPYNGSAYAAVATVNGGASLEGVIPTLTYYSGTVPSGTSLGGAPSNAGTYDVLATFAGSADYPSASATVTFSITKATVTVNVLDGGGGYTGSPYPASATVDSSASLEGVSPTFTYYSGTAASGSPLGGAPAGAGTYTVLASFAGSTDYAAGAASKTYSISQAGPTVSVSDPGGTYTGSPIAATTSSIEGILPTLIYYSGTAASGTPLGSTPSTAGTYTVLASFGGSADYTSGDASTTFVISRATATLTVNDGGGPYTGSAYPATDTVNGGTSLESVMPTLIYYSGTVASGTPLGGAPSTVGTYFVLASFAGSTDYTSGAASTTFSIAKATSFVSVTDPGGSYTGSTYGATAMVDGGASLEGVAPTVTYYSGTAATGTALSGAPSVVGTYTALASFAGSTDYASGSATKTFSITPAAPFLNLLDGGGPYTGSPYGAAEMINGGASLEGVTPTLTYYSGTAPTGTALTGAPSIVGTYTVLASFAGSTDYASASKSLSFSITTAAVSVTVTELGGTYTGTSYSATDTVNGSTSLEGVTPTLIYYSGTAATGTPLSGAPSNAGTYDVLASFAGSTDYASGAGSTTFTINKAAPTVSVADPGGTYTGSPISATTSSIESVTPTLSYYSGTATTGTPLGGVPSNAGTYAVLASFAGSTDYTSGAASTTFTISKAAAPVGVLDPGGTYNGSPYAASDTVSGGSSLEGITPSLTYYSGTAATGSALGGAPSKVGTYTVLASFGGSTDYTSARASVTFSIIKAMPSVTVNDPGGPFTGSSYPASDTVNGGASVEGVTPTLTYYSGTIASGTPLGGAPTAVGTYTVLASFAGSSDYTLAAASTTFQIGKTTPTINVIDLGGTYSGSPYLASATVNGGASLEGVTPSLTYYSGTAASGTALGGAPAGAGTYTVLASFAGSMDYASAAASITYAIVDAASMVTVTDHGGVYNGAAYPATSPSIEGVAAMLTYYSGTSAGGTALTAAPSTVGTYTVLASFAGSTDYNSGTASAIFSITAAVPTVSVLDPGGPFTGSAFTGSASVAGVDHLSAGSLEGVTPAISYYSGTAASGTELGGAPSAAGTYTILASFAGSTDYISAIASSTFVIGPAAPTVTVTDLGGVYNGSSYPATEMVNGAASLEGVTPTITYYVGTAATGTALGGVPSAAGTYTALASFAGSVDYSAARASVTFSITKAPPTVSVNDAGGTYSGAAFPATTSSIEGVTPTLSYYSGTAATGAASPSAPSLAGTYTVLASFAGSADYRSGTASATFTVAKAAPSVSVSDPGGTYSGSAFPATTSSIEGITPSLTYYSGTAASGSALSGAPKIAGTYTVLASFAESADFTSGTASATFTINQAAPTVSVTDLGGTYSGSAFPATTSSIEGVLPTLSYFAGASASGSALTGAPSLVGTYTALASFAGSTDYTSGTNSVTFTISPAGPPITVSDAGGTYNGSPFPASTSSIEGVTPTLSYYSGRAATGTALAGAPSTAGTYTALASFSGSSDYASGTASTSFTISRAATSVQVTDHGGSFSGSAYTATATVSGQAGLEGVAPTLTYYSGMTASGAPLAATPSLVGTYTVLASFAGSTDYATSSASTSFAIGTSTPPVSVTDLGGVYTSTSYPATATVNGGASLEGVMPALHYYPGTTATGNNWTSTQPVQVGTYTAAATFPGSADFGSAVGSTTFSISRAVPTVTIVDAGGNYTGSPFPATAKVAGVGSQSTAASTLEGAGLALSYFSGTAASGTPLGGAPSAAGTYTALASFAGSLDYASAAASITFTIIGKTIPTVTVSDGGPYTSYPQPASGFVNGLSSLEGLPAFIHYYPGTSGTGNNWSSSAPAQVGTYTVVATFNGTTDYTSAVASETFSITAVAPTVTVTDAGGVANGSVFAATARVSGIGNQTAPVIALEGVAPSVVYYSGTSASGTPLNGPPSAVGTYSVLASFAGSIDYISGAASATFSITPKNAPTVTVSDGGTYTSFGLPATAQVNGAANLEGVTPVLHYFTGTTTGANWTTTPPSLVGTYTVLATFAGSADYNSAAGSSTYSITRATPSLTVSDGGGTANGSQPFPATVQVAGVGSQSAAASGLEGVLPSLIYYSGTSAAGTPLGGAPSAAGTYSVLASFAGSADYAAATASTSFTIIPDPFITPTSGNGQVTAVYSPFAQQLTVKVTNLAGQPVSGAPVTFALPTAGAGGTFPGGTTSVVVATNSAGTATAPVLTANGLVGTFVVTASTPGEHNGQPAKFVLSTQQIATASDPLSPGQVELLVGGAAGSDQIHVALVGSSLDVTVSGPALNVEQLVPIPSGGFSRLVIHGGPNQNQIQVDRSVTTPTWIYADGNVGNTIQVGGGPAIVEGGSGPNMITGGSGPDVLLAGLGKAIIRSGSGAALVIGGTTNYDANDAALAAILAEWSSPDSVAARLDKLADGTITAANTAIVLNSSTVHSNEQQNTLIGSGPADGDAFFANLATHPDLLANADETQEIF